VQQANHRNQPTSKARSAPEACGAKTRAAEARAPEMRCGSSWLARASARLPLAAALLGCGAALLGCGAAAPPADAEYPALVLPARLPSQPSARPSSGPSSPASASTGSGTAAGGAPGSAAAAAAGASAAPSGAASTLSSTSVPAPHGHLPDPQPLSERAQWSYPVVYDRGTIRVGDPEPMCLSRPQPTPRRMGRFAFELWLGRELVDRLRFDFPLLATEEPPAGPRRPLRETPRFAPGAHVSVTLRIPASERAATARIFDRATGESIAVPWPPRSSEGVTRARPCPPAKPRAGAPPARPARSPQPSSP
jgi:hypothetical protein